MQERVLTQPRVMAEYLGLLALPLPGRLNLLHMVEPSRSLLAPASTLFWLLGHVAALVLACIYARRMPLASFAVLWFYLHLAIESSPLPLEMMYEHRTYLPSVAFAWLAPYALFSLLPARPVLASSLCVMAVLTLGVGTLMRNEVWRSELSLWSDVVIKSPTSPRAHNNVGLAYANRERYQEAIPHYQEAIRLGPAGYGDPRSNLGFALAAEGRSEQAILWYREAVRAQPNHAHAHCHLGIALKQIGDYEQAERHLQIALALVPSYALAREHLLTLHERDDQGPREPR
jgi:tetratricopeptide (TPR) repeat protein